MVDGRSVMGQEGENEQHDKKEEDAKGQYHNRGTILARAQAARNNYIADNIHNWRPGNLIDAAAM
jgi:hypothetical protein